MKNGDFPWLCKRLPEGTTTSHSCRPSSPQLTTCAAGDGPQPPPRLGAAPIIGGRLPWSQLYACLVLFSFPDSVCYIMLQRPDYHDYQSHIA